jgi:hypothetical protein
VVLGFVSMRIGDVPNVLGFSSDGSIYTSDRRLCSIARHCGWSRLVSDVQSCDSHAPAAEVSQLGSRSTLWVPAVGGQTPCPRDSGNQVGALCSSVASRTVERLIGTIRREYLDQTLFWTTADLEEKLQLFQDYFNRQRVHSGLEGKLPDPDAPLARLKLDSYHRWQQHCRGLYQTPIAA